MNLIILPIRNEEQTISETLNRLCVWCEKAYTHYKILFIDDKSSDETMNLLRGEGRKNVYFARNKFDGGKGSALKAGYILADLQFKLRGNDVVIFMDSDGQIDPAELGTFKKLMNLYNADVVIGNKRHLYSTLRYSWKRRIVSMGYNFLVRNLFGLNCKDTQCGIKMFRKCALDIVIEKVTSKNYAFDLEVIVALKEKGMRVIDAPVNIDAQNNAGSVNIKNILKTLVETINIWIKKKKGIYRNGKNYICSTAHK